MKYKAKPPFVVEYRHNGTVYGTTVGGDTWAEAEQHLRSIGANGRIIGSDASSYRVTTLNAFPLSLWIRFRVWLANIVRDQ